VRQGVGGGDSPEVVRVVHDRGEEVHRLYEGGASPEREHSGIVQRGRVHQNASITWHARESFESVSQVRRTELGGSTRALHPLRELNLDTPAFRQRDASGPREILP